MPTRGLFPILSGHRPDLAARAVPYGGGVTEPGAETGVHTGLDANVGSAGGRMSATRWWLTLDAVAVVAFVVIGRRTHQESETLLDVIETAGPFLWALLAAWAVTRAWRSPLSWSTGLGVFAITYAGGMLLRRFGYGDTTAAVFIVITNNKNMVIRRQ